LWYLPEIPKSCNGMNVDRSVFLLQGKIFKANVFTYTLLNTTTFETWFVPPNILKLSHATNSSFFFLGTGRYQFNFFFSLNGCRTQKMHA